MVLSAFDRQDDDVKDEQDAIIVRSGEITAAVGLVIFATYIFGQWAIVSAIPLALRKETAPSLL